MMRMQITLATVVIAVLLLAAEAPAAYIWDGGGTDGSWADGDNWAGVSAPPTVTTERIHIDSDQVVGTSVLDQDRTVGGVYFYEGYQTSHTFDLGGYTLTLTGKWQTDGGTNNPSGGVGTITNGTLKFGSGSSISLEGYQSSRRGTLQFSADGSGSIHTDGLGSISGGGYAAFCTLDLQNATVVGGTFEAARLCLKTRDSGYALYSSSWPGYLCLVWARRFHRT